MLSQNEVLLMHRGDEDRELKHIGAGGTAGGLIMV